jgi:hypothetical protein
VSCSWRAIIDTFFGQPVHITTKKSDVLCISSKAIQGNFTNWTRDLQESNFTSSIRILELFCPTTPIFFYNSLSLLALCRNLYSPTIGDILGAHVTGQEKDLDFNLEQWLESRPSPLLLRINLSVLISIVLPSLAIGERRHKA